MKTILLVEDNADDVCLMRRAWKKAHMRFPLIAVENGQQGIDYLAGLGRFQEREKFPFPGLVLLDLKLPLQSGLKVLEWIRAQPRLSALPVVVLSSSKNNADIEKAYDLGVNSYLVKPGSVDLLLDLVTAINLYWLNLNQAPMFQPA
jgi:CheY-like chemotaxis protein